MLCGHRGQGRCHREMRVWLSPVFIGSRDLVCLDETGLAHFRTVEKEEKEGVSVPQGR